MTARFALLFCFIAASLPAQTLPGTQPLTREGDRGAEMVAGIDRYLTRAIEAAPASRAASRPSRNALRRLIGATDTRLPFETAGLVSTLKIPALVANAASFRVVAVRWPVLPGLTGEGLLLTPRRAPLARVIAIPDADTSPEQFVGLAPGLSEPAQLGRRLAENGIEVLIPTLIDRKDAFSGNPAIRMTNMPHREWLHRQLFPVGRHLLGLEVQKVLAALDWSASIVPKLPIGIVGYGEGGIVAMMAAALDDRIESTLISGAFEPREAVWRQPIYRTVWGQLNELGDAEIAGLIAPRALVIEASAHPKVDGPPPQGKEKERPRRGASPGKIVTPPLADVQREYDRARKVFAAANAAARLQLIPSGDGTGEAGTKEALQAFAAGLKITAPISPPFLAPKDERPGFDAASRQQAQVAELVEFAQRLVRQSDEARQEVWKRADLSSADAIARSSAPLRQIFWDDVIGRMPPPSEALKVESRRVYDQPTFEGYEVTIPVWPDVFASGILLLPKDLKPGEKRPAVVVQHGLNDTPQMLIEASDAKKKEMYGQIGAKLAERGFIVFAPQNPYVGDEAFRVLLRKALPLRLSLFSFITGQHQRITGWLAAQPFVDPTRIGFYGLSYGGKTAMRVGPLVDLYAAIVCSGDFNEWIWKVTSVTQPFSYMFTPEYDMLEWNLANQFNYGELAALIAPRPFFVERGHRDPVGIDEWVAYEYAKVRRLYDEAGISDRTGIEFFNGGHKMNAVGAVEFLHKHLNWPVR
jgi:dienelactone hydrolase